MKKKIFTPCFRQKRLAELNAVAKNAEWNMQLFS
jgi:hypothetical protein